MTERYTRNIPAITADEQALLQDKSVLVVGCGGLGGYAIEYLARLGVGHITAVDGDVFCESNLNRQILSSVANIGQPKSSEAANHVVAINPEIEIKAINEFFTEDNATEILKGIDLVIDALDNIKSRLVLEDACEQAGITIVHGAVQGWTLQTTIVQPGSKILHNLYRANSNESSVHDVSTDNHDAKTCICPAPACCAAIQVSEALKILIGRDSSLSGNILFWNLQTMESYTIPLS